jgi:hypothetical protein
VQLAGVTATWLGRHLPPALLPGASADPAAGEFAKSPVAAEGHDLGEASRLAAATGAYLCFEDEAGQNLRPPKARTWAPRGHTPVVRVSGRGSGRVSVAGLARYKPGALSRFFYRARTHRGRICQRRAAASGGQG